MIQTSEYAPSGTKAHGYGEILIRTWLTGEPTHPRAETMIMAPEGLPNTFMFLAVEQFMRHCAGLSNAGFEKALELFVEGAMKARKQ